MRFLNVSLSPSISALSSVLRAVTDVLTEGPPGVLPFPHGSPFPGSIHGSGRPRDRSRSAACNDD
eukprot:285259-Karenia_brevis.AAC.1